LEIETMSAADGERQAKHLRALRDRARRIGKKNSSDLFELGAILEEAADLLRGRFGVWVEHECGIEPRTAHGYRRAHTRLGSHKTVLIEQRVLPTVIIKLAAARDDVQTEAIRMIESGRRLRVKDVQSLIKERSAADPSRLGSRAARLDPRQSLKGLITNAVSTAETRAETLVSRLEQLDPGDMDQVEALRREATALAGMLAGMLDLLPEESGDAVTLWASVKDALAIFSTTSNTRHMPAAADRVLMAYQAACRPEPAAARIVIKPANASIQSSRSCTPEAVSADRHHLTALEVCAGAGGQALGIERAGFRHVALVEVDRHACETLRANFPGANVLEQDLRTFDPAPYHGVDLLCGGVPCQPFSQAGKMRGSRDDRDLFLEAMRIIEQARPRAIMLENVTGLLQSKFDDYRFDILQHLKRLGYDAEWRTLDASHFGVPQRRVRSILVAFRDDAMQRFAWPAPDPHYVNFPWTITAALIDMVASRDWKGVAKWVEMADALAPTITGGSALKRGMDLGQKKTSLIWRRRGFNSKKTVDDPPGPDDEDLFLTLPMLAKLQSFPPGWKFRGPKLAIFKQIANAFPHVVALHLGCAIRSALTGVTIDPKQEIRRFFRNFRLGRKPIHVRPDEYSPQDRPAALPGPVRSSTRLLLSTLSHDRDQIGPEERD
jgi:site-specific DNA-cytosine methylase